MTSDQTPEQANDNLVFLRQVQGIIRLPDQIFERSMHGDPKQYMWRMVIMIAFAHTLWVVWGYADISDIVDKIAAFLIMPLIFAPLIMFGLYIQSTVCLAFAHRLGGPDAQFNKMLAAVLWAQAPYVLLAIVFAFLMLLRLFGVPSDNLKIAFFISTILLFFWTLVLVARFISRVCNFSVWRGFFIYLTVWSLLVATIIAGELLLRTVSMYAN